MSDFNVDQQYGSGANYFKASDLQGRRLAVTISAVNLEENFNKNGKVIVLSFANSDKKFSLNSTNARMIRDLFNEADARNWIGKTISLRPDKTQNPQGATVDCIRVDFELPPQVPFNPQTVPQQAAVAQQQYAQAQNQPVQYGQPPIQQNQPVQQYQPPINPNEIPF